MLNTRKARAGEDQELLLLREDQFNDLKSRLIKPAACQKTYVAFANSDGGELYVGLEDHKHRGERINGFQNPEEANALVKHLLLSTTPTVEAVFAEYIDFGSRGVVLRFDIPKSPSVHHTADDEYYIRTNASTQRIKGEQVQRLAYAKGIFSYEKQVVSDLEAEPLITGKVLFDYLTRIKSSLSPEAFVSKNKLAKIDKGFTRPTVACVLLFDEEPQASLDTRCAIKVYRLQTSEAEYRREHLQGDPITIEGPVEQQINKVIQWVNAVLKNVSYIDNGKMKPLKYPAEALKELLVNAVIHRDYSINDDIHVRIFDDRIEIQSPGRFPGYITRENIRSDRFSRNTQLVKFLHKLPNPPNKDIGEGLDHAFNEMSRAGLVAPDIREKDNSVCVTVRHKKIASVGECVINYLKANETISARIAAELSGEGSRAKVNKTLKKLVDQGEIEPTPDRHDSDELYRIRRDRGYAETELFNSDERE